MTVIVDARGPARGDQRGGIPLLHDRRPAHFLPRRERRAVEDVGVKRSVNSCEPHLSGCARAPRRLGLRGWCPRRDDPPRSARAERDYLEWLVGLAVAKQPVVLTDEPPAHAPQECVGITEPRPIQLHGDRVVLRQVADVEAVTDDRLIVGEAEALEFLHHVRLSSSSVSSTPGTDSAISGWMFVRAASSR